MKRIWNEFIIYIDKKGNYVETQSSFHPPLTLICKLTILIYFHIFVFQYMTHHIFAFKDHNISLLGKIIHHNKDRAAIKKLYRHIPMKLNITKLLARRGSDVITLQAKSPPDIKCVHQKYINRLHFQNYEIILSCDQNI